MITATGKKEPYITELTDGIHLFSADTPLAAPPSPPMWTFRVTSPGRKRKPSSPG